VVGLIVDLSDPDAERLPLALTQSATLHGVALPRLAVAPGIDPLPLVLTKLRDTTFLGENPSRPDPVSAVGKK
jgi:hypothetical protein